MEQRRAFPDSEGLVRSHFFTPFRYAGPARLIVVGSRMLVRFPRVQ
jgi:hypothetical protein